MTNRAHVPVQTWKGCNPRELFGEWFSYLGKFKTLVGLVLLLLGTCLLLPCLLSLFAKVISSLPEAITDRRATTYLLALKSYQPLSQEDLEVDALLDLRSMAGGGVWDEKENFKFTITSCLFCFYNSTCSFQS